MEDLVKKAMKGDGQAFVELMEKYKQSMYKVARSYLNNKEDIADAIQDSIEACYCGLPYLNKTEYIHTWLIRIVINKCKNTRRKQKREYLIEEFPENADICVEFEQCEFENLMQSLDEKYRTVLLLYYGEGFKIREIAQILDMEESTVKSRLARGREKVKEVYEIPVIAAQRR